MKVRYKERSRYLKKEKIQTYKGRLDKIDDRTGFKKNCIWLARINWCLKEDSECENYTMFIWATCFKGKEKSSLVVEN